MLLVNLPLGGVMDPQRNSMVEFTAEEQVQYVDGTYEQVYPVYETQQTFDASYAQALQLQNYTTASGKVVRVVAVEGKIYKATVAGVIGSAVAAGVLLSLFG